MYKNVLLFCDKTIGLRLAVALESLLIAVFFILAYFAIKSLAATEPDFPNLPLQMFLVPAFASIVIGVFQYVTFSDSYIRKSRGLADIETKE